MAHPIMRHSCDCDNLARVAPNTLIALEEAYFFKRSSCHATKSNEDCTNGKRPVFPFMELPPEIRETIYTMHFDQEQKPRKSGTLCPAGSACPHRLYNNWVPVRALFLVSKIVYNESMPLYYRFKTFGFKGLDRMTQFFDTIGALQRSFITNISFIYNADACERPFKWKGENNAVIAFRALAGCPALQTLRIGFEMWSLPTNERKDDYGLLTVLDLDGLLRLRGLTTVDVVVYDPWDRFREVKELESVLQVIKLPRGS